MGSINDVIGEFRHHLAHPVLLCSVVRLRKAEVHAYKHTHTHTHTDSFTWVFKKLL